MAKREELQEGMYVKVKNILKGTETEKRYSINRNMRDMQGKLFPIHEIAGALRINIYCKDAGKTYVFHPDDLEIYEPPPPPEPVTFDPENLRTP